MTPQTETQRDAQEVIATGRGLEFVEKALLDAKAAIEDLMATVSRQQEEIEAISEAASNYHAAVNAVLEELSADPSECYAGRKDYAKADERLRAALQAKP